MLGYKAVATKEVDASFKVAWVQFRMNNIRQADFTATALTALAAEAGAEAEAEGVSTCTAA